MKRITVLIIGSMFIAMQAIAQTEDKKELIIKDKRLENTDFINKPIQSIGIENKTLSIDHPALSPAFDSTTMSHANYELNPINYNRSGIFPLYKRLFVFLEGEQKSYLNLASYNLAHTALGWQINNRLSLRGGVLAIKQFTNNSLHGTDRSGAKFNINYFATDRLEFNIWGQYLTDSYQTSNMDYLLPQTGVGASATVHLGGGSQFGVGTEYQYDKQKEKWNYNSGGKLKLNF